MEARIIKLGPDTQVTRVISFDEAFEGGSNIFGLGRNKVQRQEHKTEKIEAKKKKKLAKVNSKREVRAAKQGAKDEKRTGRIGGRGLAQQARQQNRTSKVEAHQGRKTTRKSLREERRAMGKDELPQDPLYQDDSLYQDEVGSAGYSDDGSGEDYTGDSGDDQNYDDGSGSDSGEDYADDSGDDSTDYQEQGQEDAEQDPMFYEEDPFYSDDEDIYNFDNQVSDASNEMSDGKNEVKVPKAIQDIANKIEWNKEYVVRLDADKNDILIKVPDENVEDFNTEIIRRKERVGELGSILKSFINFEGDFDDQTGDFLLYNTENADRYSGADGAGAERMHREKARRHMIAKKAIGNAKQARQKVTIVKTSLNPTIEGRRVTVPASSNMIGPEGNDRQSPSQTGLIGLDQQNDYDSPPKLDVVMSNFSGKNISWEGVVIGTGIGIVAIALLKKYKLV